MVKAIAALITSAVLISSPVLAEDKVSYNVQPPKVWQAPSGFAPIYYVTSAELQRICRAAPNVKAMELKPGEEVKECAIGGLGYAPDPCLFPLDAYARRICHLNAHVVSGWPADHPRK